MLPEKNVTLYDELALTDWYNVLMIDYISNYVSSSVSIRYDQFENLLLWASINLGWSSRGLYEKYGI